MRIVWAIGFEGQTLHPDCGALFLSHSDRSSLDDCDIVLFRLPNHPSMATRFSQGPTFQGKPQLSEEKSWEYQEMLAYWKSELTRALDAGKTIFVLADAIDEVVVEVSRTNIGTPGRPRMQTNVDFANSYQSLPAVPASLVQGQGTTIRLSPAARILSRYWHQFGEYSEYEMRFADTEGWQVLLTTRTESNVVGALYERGDGHLLLLPPVELETTEEDSDKEVLGGNDKEGEQEDRTDESGTLWLEEERIRSIQFIHELIAIDAELRGEIEQIPTPNWALAEAFATPRIAALDQRLIELAREQHRLQDAQEGLLRDMNDARSLQLLLYGQGHPLESAVLKSLRLMGFEAEPYSGEGSEFDAVFTADAIRLLGEVEGRDHGPINIDKITQLERNISEDFARDGVESHAKGVLFGNPQRLTSPSERSVAFTAKCHASAQRNQFALVLTAEMFPAVAYLESHPEDARFAADCRRAIIQAQGTLVVFPQLPRATRARRDQRRRDASNSR